MSAPRQTLAPESNSHQVDEKQRAQSRLGAGRTDWADHRPSHATQGQLQRMIIGSPRMIQQKASIDLIHQAGVDPRRPSHATGVGGTAPLHQHALAGTLNASQVRMAKTEQPLSAAGLGELMQGLNGVGEPGARPIPSQLRAGAASIHDQAVHLSAPAWGDRSAASLARGVAALRPQAVSLSVNQGRYQLKARLNPWLEILGGTIKNIDSTTKWNQSAPGSKTLGASWVFISVADLKSAGISAPSVGQTLPVTLLVAKGLPTAPASTASAPSYTIPSGTYQPSSMPPAFHSLAGNQMPPIPFGQAWHSDTSTGQWQLLRDPLLAPSSPGTDVDAGMNSAGVHYTVHVPDPISGDPSHRRVLGGLAHVVPKGSTFTGPRDYPMTSADYKGPSGEHFDRGHVVDHADGDATSTASSSNYVPENPNLNRGFRNHIVQGTRPTGGYYRAAYQYPPTVTRTTDGTAIPDYEDLTVAPTGAPPSYFHLDNRKYPPSNSVATGTSFQQPGAFTDPTIV